MTVLSAEKGMDYEYASRRKNVGDLFVMCNISAMLR